MATKKNAPADEPVEDVAAENNSLTTEDEAAAMKEQVAYQLAQLLKMADKMGIKLDEVFEKPPVDITVIKEPEPVVAPAVQATAPIEIRPGQALPGGGWVQWKKGDLNPEDTIEFSPLPIPGLVFPFTDENGYQKIRLDVNGLVCWLTCGVPNKINKYFYSVYEQKLNAYRELEAFKRNGPEYAPWGKKGPNGEPSWMYVPAAPSFGLTIDGHSVRLGGPTPLDATPSAPAESAPPAEPQK